MFFVGPTSNNNQTDPLQEYQRIKSFIDGIEKAVEEKAKKKADEEKAKKGDFWTIFLRYCVYTPFAILITNTIFMFCLLQFVKMAQQIRVP